VTNLNAPGESGTDTSTTKKERERNEIEDKKVYS
jgi:hypothetical protein